MYIKREDILQAMQSVIKDSNCPVHIAAEIEQIIHTIPSVNLYGRCKDFSKEEERVYRDLFGFDC